LAGPEIYAIAEIESGDAVPALARLERAFSAATISCVLLTSKAGGGPLTAADAKKSVDFIQSKGAAALVGDAALARLIRADGVHLGWSKSPLENYAEAREILGKRAIVGADAGKSRHDAMSLAEAGADYIAFGIPEHVEDRDTAFLRQCDLVAWWSEIFEIPCVAFDVGLPEHAARLAAAGADYVTVRLSLRQEADEAERAMRATRAAIARGEVPA